MADRYLSKIRVCDWCGEGKVEWTLSADPESDDPVEDLLCEECAETAVVYLDVVSAPPQRFEVATTDGRQLTVPFGGPIPK